MSLYALPICTRRLIFLNYFKLILLGKINNSLGKIITECRSYCEIIDIHITVNCMNQKRILKKNVYKDNTLYS